LRPRSVSAAHRSMLPWALDRRVSRCCRAFAPPRRCWTFRLAVPNPLQRPRPERRGKARSLGLVWLRAPDVAADPKVDCVRFAGPLTARRLLRFRSARSISRRKPIGIGRVWLRRFPEGRRLGRIPHGPRRIGWDASGSAPRNRSASLRCDLEKSTASVRTPEGARFSDEIASHLRRDRFAIPAHAPKSGVRWFELVLSILPRLPAYVRKRPLAADSFARPKAFVRRLRATRARIARMLRRAHLRDPRRNRTDGRAGRPPEGGPLTAHGSGALQQAAAAGLGPDSHRLHRNGQEAVRRPGPLPDPKAGGPTPKRRGRGWCRASHLLVEIRHVHRSARAEMDRGPPRVLPTGVGRTF